jgi:hypothetical protein
MNKPNEFTELFKCYQCDCLTAPYCSIGGELCVECFDYSHFQHKKARSKFPGTFLDIKCDEKCTATTAATTMTKAAFFVVRSPPDGDCLYTCVSNALDQKISVKYLRRLVSRMQTIEMYNAYMALADDPNFPDYHNMRQIQSFDQFRHFIQLCGSDVGAAECIWGDENALEIISNEYGITFVIFNEKGSIVQKVEPNNETVLPASSAQPVAALLVCNQRFILLRLHSGSKGHAHYDLLKFNDKTILTYEMWKYLLSKTST